jgi:hypothetical protein
MSMVLFYEGFIIVYSAFLLRVGQIGDWITVNDGISI